VQCPNQDRQAA